MKKKALLVGNNYPGTRYRLHGCVNDVNTMADIITQRYDFKTTDVRMLTNKSADTTNMLERLRWLVDGAVPGDVLYFHYSGHGSQCVNRDYSNDNEPDGMDEVLVPYDMNWRDKMITDDMLKEIFDQVPAGVNLTVVLDSCHSGTGLDQEESYQPFGMGAAREFETPNRIRGITMPDDIANRGRGLNLTPRKRSVRSRDVDATGLLISGCQSQQTSADAWIHHKYMGACTYFLAETLLKNNYDISYKDLVLGMNQSLRMYGYTQSPELNGSSLLWEKKFLKSEKE